MFRMKERGRGRKGLKNTSRLGPGGVGGGGYFRKRRGDRLMPQKRKKKRESSARLPHAALSVARRRENV